MPFLEFWCGFVSWVDQGLVVVDLGGSVVKIFSLAEISVVIVNCGAGVAVRYPTHVACCVATEDSEELVWDDRDCGMWLCGRSHGRRYDSNRFVH